jgi:serine/threonine kinase 38
VESYEPLTIIGEGAFGEVRICRDKETGELVAIKKLKKEDMHKKNQILHIRSEKEVLSLSNSPWVVDLKVSRRGSNESSHIKRHTNRRGITILRS